MLRERNPGVCQCTVATCNVALEFSLKLLQNQRFESKYTVEPPIVDPPTKGHNIIDLSTKDTGQGPKHLFPYSSNTF